MLAVQAAQSDGDVGMATSMGIFFRSLGQVFGVAIGGVIFQNRFDSIVTNSVNKGIIPPSFFIPGSRANDAYSLLHTFPLFVQRQYQEIYASSLQGIWFVMTSLGVFALLGCSVVKNLSLDKEVDHKQ
jgi:hypothetical protein